MLPAVFALAARPPTSQPLSLPFPTRCLRHTTPPSSRDLTAARHKPPSIPLPLPAPLATAPGVAQLVFLCAAPAAHQRRRFGINLANRLAKLATVSWAAYAMSAGQIMAEFTAKMNSDPAPALPAPAAAAAGGGAAAGATAAAAAAGLFASPPLKVLRTVGSLPMLWASHAVNFLLPFWVMLPFQLVTLAVAARVAAPTVCALAAQPPALRAAAVRACGWLRGAMELLLVFEAPGSTAARGGSGSGSGGAKSGSASAGSGSAAAAAAAALYPAAVGIHSGGAAPSAAAAAAAGAGGEGPAAAAAPAAAAGGDERRELLLLVMFTYVLVLLIIPCTVAYSVELAWKSKFVRAKRRTAARTADGDGGDDDGGGGCLAGVVGAAAAPWLAGYAAYLLACLVWVACEAAVALLPPVDCGGGGGAGAAGVVGGGGAP